MDLYLKVSPMRRLKKWLSLTLEVVAHKELAFLSPLRLYLWYDNTSILIMDTVILNYMLIAQEDYQASVPGGNVDDVLRPVEPGRRAQLQPEGETPVRGAPPAPAAAKLPEPSFRVIDDYDIPDAPPLPNSYIR
jgi:hypothetical protein